MPVENIISYALILLMFTIGLISFLLHQFAPQHLSRNIKVHLPKTRSVSIPFGGVLFGAFVIVTVLLVIFAQVTQKPS